MGVARMPVVLMILTLGVLEEADVGGNEASGSCDIVHVEVLDGQRGLEALVELGAALFGHHRQQVRVRAQGDGLIGGLDDRVDLGADGLDTGEAHALAHPVDADHRLDEEPIGQLGGFRPEGADLQGLLEDVTQLGLTVGGVPTPAAVILAYYGLLFMWSNCPEHSFELQPELRERMALVMDGLAATRAIRALPDGKAALPIIALTADAYAETRAACFDAGMNGFLSKPVSLDALAHTVARSAVATARESPPVGQNAIAAADAK